MCWFKIFAKVFKIKLIRLLLRLVLQFNQISLNDTDLTLYSLIK
jgi:hypothetical protein